MDSPLRDPVMRSIDIFFAVSLNKLLNIHLSCHWFDTCWWTCHLFIMITTATQSSTNITITKQNATKPRDYFTGYIVDVWPSVSRLLFDPSIPAEPGTTIECFHILFMQVSGSLPRPSDPHGPPDANKTAAAKFKGLSQWGDYLV